MQLPDGRIGRFEVPEGTTPEQVLKFAKRMKEPAREPEQTATDPSHSPVGQLENPADTWRGSVSRAARPLLEGGGAALGTVFGAGAGLATGPGAPAASPVLGVAGGGLGYAMGKRGADILDESLGIRRPQGMADTALETVNDLANGASLEMGGQLLAPAFMAIKSGGKTAFRAITEPAQKAFTQKGAEASAGNIIKANTSAGPIYAKNAAEASAIEKEIPGLKFTMGQQTNDPNLIKLERAQMRQPGSGADMNAEQLAANNEALRAYYGKAFGGKEGVDDLITSLQGQRSGLGQAEQTMMGTARAEAGSLPASDPVQTGQRIVDTLKIGEKAAKARAGELYDEVPGTIVPVDDMLGDFARLSKPMSKFEDPANVPDILEVVRRAFKPQKVGGGLVDQYGKEMTAEGLPRNLSLDDLQGLRSELMEESSRIMSSQTPNRRMASRYDQAAKAVDKVISAAEDTEATGALREANRFFREDYAGVFRKGTVGQLLRPGANREATRTPLAQIPSKVWNARNLSAADDLLKAAPNDAPDIMRDHAAYDLLEKAVDAEGNIVTSKMNQWFARNRPLLKRFGLEDDFKGVANAQQAADAAKKASVEFEKSVAGRILGSDPERAVAAAFSGRNAGQEAAKLMRMVEKDPAGKKGLQKAFADHLMGTIETTAKDVVGSPIISNAAFQKTMAKYAPVMRVLYKGEPEKIKTLNTMRRAYEISTRNTRSPIGGGSDTAENILTQIGKIQYLSRTATVAKGLMNILSRYGDDKINAMVNRALFDPDYAQTLIRAAGGKIPEKELAAVLDGKIIRLDDYRKTTEAARAAGMGGATMGALNGDAD